MTMKEGPVRELDVLVVGAGFAGLYILHRLRQMGLKALVVEQAAGVGGTWYWNRYPGARCDVESLEYSYKFDHDLQQEWTWSERYATQPEILRYLEHVADRFALRPDIRFNTRVIGATFNEETLRWNIGTEQGDQFSARFFVAATGCLSLPNHPTYPGQSSFKGKVRYTSHWPHKGVDFTGKRVAVIGTGSSAIQSIPVIADQAAQLTVFQRTPNFSVPACNRPLNADEVAKTKVGYDHFREHNLAQSFGFNLTLRNESAQEVSAEERAKEFERRWTQLGGLHFLGAFDDILLDSEANGLAADIIRKKIREIVKDPRKAELLQPTDHPIGCKRLCSDDGYYATFNLPHVDLVDLRSEAISGIDENGIHFGERFSEFDEIVYATGFDALTGALLKMNVVGRDGRRLNDEWMHGPHAYLGLMIEGFPNLFTITGPGSPAVLTNMAMAIEDHVDWISDCIQHVTEQSVAAIEAVAEPQQEWMTHLTEIAEATQFTGCNSWYSGSNVPEKPKAFALYVGFANYRKHIADVARNGYPDFCLTPEVATA